MEGKGLPIGWHLLLLLPSNCLRAAVGLDGAEKAPSKKGTRSCRLPALGFLPGPPRTGYASTLGRLPPHWSFSSLIPAQDLPIGRRPRAPLVDLTAPKQLHGRRGPATAGGETWRSCRRRRRQAARPCPASHPLLWSFFSLIPAPGFSNRLAPLSPLPLSRRALHARTQYPRTSRPGTRSKWRTLRVTSGAASASAADAIRRSIVAMASPRLRSAARSSP